MMEPRWIEERALILLHAESIAEHGGLEGVRDQGLLASALARPRNLLAYEGETDIVRLAAAYGVGLVRNHPFADGNKRAAFLAVGLFLGLNGLRLTASQADAVLTMLALAAGELDEQAFTSWLREHVRPRRPQ